MIESVTDNNHQTTEQHLNLKPCPFCGGKAQYFEPPERHTSEQRMDAGFALFNLHVNDAGERAKAAYIACYGQDNFNENIQPFIEQGVMSMFNVAPTPSTVAYILLVHFFVNEQLSQAIGIRCTVCLASMKGYDNKELLITAWNDRAVNNHRLHILQQLAAIDTYGQIDSQGRICIRATKEQYEELLKLVQNQGD